MRSLESVKDILRLHAARASYWDLVRMVQLENGVALVAAIALVNKLIKRWGADGGDSCLS